MTIITRIAGAIALVSITSPVAAMELNGGDFNVNYSWFDQKVGDETVDTFSFDGAVEVGFNQNFAAQLDLGRYSFGLIDERGTNIALHGIYHLNEATALGAFYGADDILSDSTDFYGVEAAYNTDQYEVEAYFGTGEDSGVDGNVYGILGAYDVTEGIAVTGSLERADIDGGFEYSKYAIGVRFSASPQAALTASIGSAEAEAGSLSGSETFFSIGAEFKFGQKAGATFGRRGLLKLIPGL